MRCKGLVFDEFTCSTVISACGREGLLNEAKEFFKYKMEDNDCPADSVTYNELVAAYVRDCLHNF